MELSVSALLRPEVEGDRGEFVDERVGKAVLAEVNGLDVGVACVAALDADIGELVGGIDRQLGVVFLVATGADDAAKLPLAQAESAEQVAAGTLAQRTQHGQRGFAAAERTQRMTVALELKRHPGADEFGVGLEEGEGEKLAGF